MSVLFSLFVAWRDLFDDLSPVPAPNGCEGKSFHTYIKAQLFHSGSDLSWRSQTLETRHDPQLGADLLWKEQFEWYYEEDDLSFIRFVARCSLVIFMPDLRLLQTRDLSRRSGER